MGIRNRARDALRRENRRRLMGPWIVVNVGYDVVRTAVMAAVFERYGLNIWAYGGFVLVFSAIYAWASLELLGALVDGNGRRAWWTGTIFAVAFAAPDIYLVAATHEVPRMLLFVLGGYVAISASVTVVSLVRRYRAKRAATAGG